MIWNFKLRNCFVAILALCCLISCEKDDDYLEEETVSELGEFEINSHKTNDNPLDNIIKKAVEDSKKFTSTIAKSTFDSINGFYIDDSRYNHLKTENYESFTFNIIDGSDSLNTKYLVLATKHDSLQQIYYQSYLAVIPKADFLDIDSSEEGKILSQNISIIKFETAFLFSKTLEFDRFGDCLRVYQVTETPYCIHDDGDEPLGNNGQPTCRPGSFKTRVLIASECNMSGDGGSLGAIDPSDGSFYNDPNDASSGGGYLNPDGSTPFSPDVTCPMGSISDGNGGCIDGGGLPGSTVDEPEPLGDPNCESVANQNEDAALQAEIDKIKTHIGEKKEYGFRDRTNEINANDRFKDLEPYPNDPAKLNIDINALNIGVIHYHPKEFPEDIFGNKQSGVLTFSDQDIGVFIGTLYQSSLDTRLDPMSYDLSNYYITMITERGVFTLKFSGNKSDLIRMNAELINQSPKVIRKRKAKFKKYTQRNPEEGLLKYLSYVFGESANNLFGLFKTEDDGSISKYKLNENDELEEPTICHEI